MGSPDISNGTTLLQICTKSRSSAGAKLAQLRLRMIQERVLIRCQWKTGARNQVLATFADDFGLIRAMRLQEGAGIQTFICLSGVVCISTLTTT